MEVHNVALLAAGVIGSGVAIVHGVLTQRYLGAPLVKIAAQQRMSKSLVRLVPVLLHFSTFIWFFGGIALIAAAFGALGPDARVMCMVWVGGAYAFGVIGNCWATRGRHPGWMLLAVALMLMAFAASGLP